MAKYKIIIYWSEKDQAYIAEVPELAGCMADGSSYQEAINNAEQVISEWTKTAVELGRYIPESKDRCCMLRSYRYCCSFARKHPFVVICLIVLGVVSFYFVNFHNGFSKINGDWGTFGDYVGGILNPVIASFAFYLIAKTYELQKTELEATRNLLGVSTNAQEKQIKLAALTALLNSNLMRIDTLKAESFVYKGKLPIPQKTTMAARIQEMEMDRITMATNPGLDRIRTRLDDIESEIEKLQIENSSLEEQIKLFLG